MLRSNVTKRVTVGHAVAPWRKTVMLRSSVICVRLKWSWLSWRSNGGLSGRRVGRGAGVFPFRNVPWCVMVRNWLMTPVDCQTTTKLGALSLLRMKPFLEVSGFEFIEAVDNVVQIAGTGGDLNDVVRSAVEWKSSLGIVEDAVTAEGVCLYGAEFLVRLANVESNDNSTRAQKMGFMSGDFWRICDSAIDRGDGFLRPEYRDVQLNLHAIEGMWQERDLALLSVDSSEGVFWERVKKVRSGMEKRRVFARMVAECGGWG